jgi:MHS family proline/betaine transporter-like MFS transporter
LWGWRAPFFFGAALAGAVWIVRLAMQESPEYERQRSTGVVPSSPLRLALKDYRAAIARGFAISALGSITYYVGITYVPAFLVAVHAMREGDAFWVSTIAACAVVLVTPFVGAASDALGRKPVLVLLCGGAVILPISMFALMAGGSMTQALTGALILAALGGGISAVGAVTSAELLPGEGRLSGLALGTTLATAIFGGLTPFLSQFLIERTGWPLVPGVMIAAVAIGILPVLMTLRGIHQAPDSRPAIRE